MSKASAGRWFHPQSVPRGFLRMYILALLSIGPETGYSIMQKIEDRTQGSWRPGAGTMYPLLKNMVTEGLAKHSGERGKGSTKQYLLTPKGRRELDQMRHLMAGKGRRVEVMGKLFSDLVPGKVFVPMMINRYREGAEVIRQKFGEIPEPERDLTLRELRLVLEAQIRWIDSEIGQTVPKDWGKKAAKAGHRP
jgi:DNA-binding PadR family transcriptional regulator